ncbi:MAG: PKD domain-containing protein [Bacteroidota bacterium]
MTKALRILLLGWIACWGHESLWAQREEFPVVIGRSINNPDIPEVVESCATGVFTFFNTGSRFTPTRYIIEFAGSARLGTDYDTITARLIIVPERVDSVSLPIIPIADVQDEGTETIYLIYTSEGITDTATLFLKDFPTIEAGRDTSFCATESIQLQAEELEDVLSYQWFPEEGLSNPQISNPLFQLAVPQDTALTLTLTVTDANNCEAVDSLTLGIFDQPVSSFIGPTKLCLGTSGQFTYVGEALPTDEFDWDFGPDATIESGAGIGPYVISWASPGEKTVCLTVADSICTHQTFCQTVEIGAAVEVEIAPVADQCFEGHSLNFNRLDTLSVDEFTWNFGEGATLQTSMEANPTGIQYESPGVKTVSLVVTNEGCTSGDQVQFELAEPPGADFSFDGEIFCQDACIRPRYDGDIRGPEQQFEWNLGSAAIPANSAISDPVCIRYSETGTQRIALTVSYKGCVDSSSQNITIQDLPIANVSVGLDTSFCEGSGGVQLSSSLDGSTAGTQYTWFSDIENPANWGISDPQSPEPVVNPVLEEIPGTATYYLIATTENGCKSNVDSARVRIKPIPKADAGEDRTFCEDSPGVLLLGKPAEDNTAPGPFIYQWSPATGLSDAQSANPLATPDSLTTYTLQISSLEGCSSILDPLDTLQTTLVNKQVLPIAQTGGDQAICTGDTLSLQGAALNTGAAEVEFNWTPTETGYIEDSTLASPRVSPIFTTVYSLVVNANGCLSKATNQTIEVKPRPTAAVDSAVSICQKERISLNAIVRGDLLGEEAFTYQWLPIEGLEDPNVANPMASPDSTTNYEFTATSSNGCASLPVETLVMVRPSPIVEISSDKDFVCLPESLTLRAEATFIKTPAGSPLSFEWGPQELFFADQRFSDSLVIVPQEPTMYYLTGSISGDCPNTDSLLIDARTAPDVDISLPDVAICQGSTILLAAIGDTSNVSFQWEGPASETLSNQPQWETLADSSALYTLLSTRSGCTDTSSVPLQVIPLPVSDFFSSSTAGCVNFTVAFMENTQDAISLIWDFGDNSPFSNEANPIHNYSIPGNYQVSLTAIGPQGCEAVSESLEIQVSDTSFANFSSTPLPIDTLTIPNADVQFVDASLNPVSWFWKFGDGKISTEKSPKHSFWQPGEYDVVLVITDSNGCVSQKQLGTYVVLNPRLFIPNVFTPNFDGIEDTYKIIYSGSDPVKTQIFDRWGKKVYEGEGAENEWDGFFNGEWVPEGVYFYDIRIGSEQYKGNVTLLR